MAGIELDRGTRGPRVDGAMRTPLPGVFATGNLVHPAETADSCALGGRHAAAAVAEHLAGESGWPIRARPGAGRRGAALGRPGPDRARARSRPPRDRFLLRSDAFLRRPRIEVAQGERTLWRGRLARLVPGRSAHIPAGWTAQVDPTAGPVTVRVPTS